MKLFLWIFLLIAPFAAFGRQEVVFTVRDSSVQSLWVNVFFSSRQMDARLYKLGSAYKIYKLAVPCDSSVRVSIGLMGQYSFTYQFRAGDSVGVYNGVHNMPFMKVENRLVKEAELNFSYLVISYNRQLNPKPNRPGLLKEATQRSLQRSLHLLDSLHEKQLLSDSFYTKTRTQLPYSAASQLMISYFQRHSKKLSADSLPDLPLFDTSAVHHPAYLEYLATYIRFFELAKSKKVTPSTACFDYVFSHIKEPFREPLLFLFLRNIYFEHPKSFEAYLGRFMTVAVDSYRKTYFEDLLATEKSDKAFTASLTGKQGMLYAAASKKTFSFADLLSQHKGKVIYLDFWASWCAPCRAEMPNSKRLSDTLKGTSFITLYISIDESQTAWAAASREMNMPAGQNFLLVQPKNSPLVKTFNLEMIPRYILVDKKGTIVNKDAPRPGAEETVFEIRRLLKD